MLFSNFALAQDLGFDVNQVIKTTSMPSDYEIMNMIDMLGVPSEEKQAVFEETKKQLMMMYQTKNASNLLNIYQNPQNSQDYAQFSQIEPPKRVKKYTNHPPLTRR